LKNKVENLKQVKGEDGIASAKPDYSFNTLIRKKYWGSDVVIVLRQRMMVMPLVWKSQHLMEILEDLVS